MFTVSCSTRIEFTTKEENFALLPVDTAFEFVRQIYEEIDFYGEFQPFDLELTEAYRRSYFQLINLDRYLIDDSRQRNYYFDEFDNAYGLTHMPDSYNPANYTYYFFDMTGNGTPDLGINTGRVPHLITYCKDQDEFSLLYWTTWRTRILGSNKLALIGERDFWFIEIDENSDEVYTIQFFLDGRYDENGEGIQIYFLGIPENSNIPENIRYDLIFRESTGLYYLEVTDEQWNQLVGSFFNSLELARENIESVTYTYEELFGDFIY